MYKWYSILYGLAVLSGCGNEPTVCTANSVFAVTVNVRDGATGEPAAFGATLVLRDGQYADSVTGVYSGPSEFSASHIGAAMDRPGTYDVTVRKTGYRTWTLSQVAVALGECGVEGVTLVVSLQR